MSAELDAAIRTVRAIHTRRRPVTPDSEDWCDDCCVDWPCDYETVVAAALDARVMTPHPQQSESWPDGMEMIHQLWEAVHGVRSSAQPRPPKVVWEELLAEVREMRHWIGASM